MKDNFEKLDNLSDNNEKDERNDEFFVTRHGPAEYKMNESIAKSDNPEAPHNPDKQDFVSDLTPEGKEMARNEAEKFFDNLDPKKDALFFASSDLVRAAETAKIYKDIAEERGFEIIKPYNVRNDLVEKIGDGEIRKIDSLSLELKNMLLEFIFHPQKDYLNEVVKDKENVSQEVLDQWEEARKIVESDNQGTWGKNYYKHSEQIAKIFPDIRTAKDLYNREFKNLTRLMKFGQKKIDESGFDKNIKVLAFSHENAFLHFLGKNFDDCGIDNCESIGFKVDGDEIAVGAKGENKKVDIE